VIQLRKLTDTPVEPELLDLAMSHLRITSDAEGSLLSQYLAAARTLFERMTGRVLLTQTYELSLSDWPTSGYIQLGRNPIASIQSVEYVDRDDATQTVSAADYVLFQPEDASGLVSFRDSFTEPETSDRIDAITVSFTAGNTSMASVPFDQRQAILFLAAHLYELRTPINVGNIVNEIPMSLNAIVTMNKIGGFVA